MEFRDYLSALVHRWPLIVLLTILGAVAAFAYDSTLPTLYKSTSSVFVSTQQGETTSELVQGSTFTQANVESYARLATMPIVLDPVISDLNLDISARALARSVSADTPLNTVIIEITVESPRSDKAALIANAVTRSLSTAVEQLSPTGPDGQSAITMATVTPAQPPNAPFAPNTRFIVLTGLLVGLALGAIVALAWELLDTRVRDADDITKVTDAPVLGTIGIRRRRDAAGLAMLVDPNGPQAQSYRRLRVNLEFADVDHAVRTVVVTSSVPGEGKSTTALNLALAMAERSARVLLIDADLRRATIGDRRSVEGSIGLTTVLVGRVPVEDAVQRWAGVLDILPSGTLPPNPDQLLASDAMATLVRRFAADYEFVVIDTPPLLAATGSLGLARLADGAIVVAQYKSTTRQQLTRSVASLEAVKARVLGIVLDRVPGPRTESYYGYQGEPSKTDTFTKATTPVHVSDDHDSPEARKTKVADPYGVA